MLDECRRRFLELDDHANGGIQIEQVGVRQLLALEHRVAGMRSESRVERAALMRVLAVAEITNLAKFDREAVRKYVAAGGANEAAFRDRHCAQRRRDRRVVTRGVHERLASEIESKAP